MDEIKIPIEVEGDAALKTVKELGNFIEKLTGSVDETNAALLENEKRLKGVDDAIKSLNNAEQKQGQLSEAQQSRLQALIIQRESLKRTISEERQQFNAQIKEMTAASGSYDQMNQILGLMRDRYRQMSEAERESASGRDLLKYIKQLDTELKSLDASMGNHQRNVGNYASATEGLSQVARGVNNGMLALSGTLSTVGIEIDKNFTKIPLALTRILAGVKSLGKGLTQVIPAIKAAGAAIQAMTVKAQALMATLTLGLSVAIGVIISQWDKISALWKDPAIDDAKRAIDDLTEAMERNAEQAQTRNTAALAAYTQALRNAGENVQAIAAAQEQYNETLRETALEEAKANKEAADRAVLLAADAKLHAKRKKAIQETTDAYNQALDAQRDANEKYEQAVNAIAKADADRVVKRVQAEETAAKKAKQLRDKALREEVQANLEEEQRIAEGAKQVEEIMERLYKAQLSAKDRELYELAARYKEEHAILDEFGGDVVTLTATYEQARRDIIEKYADEASVIRVDKARDSIEAELAAIEDVVKNRQPSSEERNPLANIKDQIRGIGDQLAALDVFREKSMQILDEELEQENLSVERRAELAQQKIDLDEQVSNKRKALWNEESQLRNKLSKEEKQYYIQTAAQALNSVGNLIGAMSDLFEESSKEQKDMQIAMAVVNGLAGVAGAIAGAMSWSWQVGPIAAGILGAMNAATVVATTAAQIRKIKSGTDDISGTGSAAAATPVVGTVLDTAALSSQLTSETEFDLQQKAQDTRVYVVEEDITRTQDDVKVTVDESEF